MTTPVKVVVQGADTAPFLAQDSTATSTQSYMERARAWMGHVMHHLDPRHLDTTRPDYDSHYSRIMLTHRAAIGTLVAVPAAALLFVPAVIQPLTLTASLLSWGPAIVVSVASVYAARQVFHNHNDFRHRDCMRNLNPKPVTVSYQGGKADLDPA